MNQLDMNLSNIMWVEEGNLAKIVLHHFYHKSGWYYKSELLKLAMNKMKESGCSITSIDVPRSSEIEKVVVSLGFKSKGHTTYYRAI